MEPTASSGYSCLVLVVDEPIDTRWIKAMLYSATTRSHIQAPHIPRSNLSDGNLLFAPGQSYAHADCPVLFDPPRPVPPEKHPCQCHVTVGLGRLLCRSSYVRVPCPSMMRVVRRNTSLSPRFRIHGPFSSFENSALNFTVSFS